MNIPTLISLARGFLALLFFSASPYLRVVAVVLAALSDYLDGFLARRLKQVTRLGTLIDPITDKLFVALALTVFWWEERLLMWQVVVFLLRDISLLLFVSYLLLKGCYESWQIRSFFSGKIMTSLQFAALVLLAMGEQVPMLLWGLLALFGATSFFELMWLSRKGFAKS